MDAIRSLCLLGCLGLMGCGNVASLVSGSCDGTQTFQGMTVQVCTESPTETVDQQATLNTLCRSGQFGSLANNWQQGTSCATAGRVGGCQRAVNGINVVTYVYPGSTRIDATVVRAYCGTIQATYVGP